MIGALASVLAAMIQDESTFARSEALYAESFKSPASFTVAHDIYPREQLVQYLMEPIYRKEVVDASIALAMLDDEGCDRWSESMLEPEILKPGMSHVDADALVDHLEFVELCNYKGEGEGFELACRVTHLRVFVAKYEYLSSPQIQ